MYTAEELKLAVAAIKNGEVSLREASYLYNIPKTTLDRNKKKVIVEKLHRGPSTILTKDEEESLVLYIKEAQNCGFPRLKVIIKERLRCSFVFVYLFYCWCPVTGATSYS